MNTNHHLFNAVSSGFVDTAWTKPGAAKPKTVSDIRSAPEIYHWLTNVFLPEIYKNQPSDEEEGSGYCTRSSTCSFAEGTVNGLTECHPWLVNGTDNCRGWYSPGAKCCDYDHSEDVAHQKL